ncbi:hypothetical protein RF11_11144 [Thelohanellus kitauei]|uniref:Uncharacterized protein n=1 Tax=Thelohanellus kitauei TaxID=669202 RepID=A0A0C2NFJ9_THEKT|nr:hypothetical protein RF11_11144 [Thelohanellus kitauei]
MSLCLTFKKMAIRDMRIEYFDDGIDDSIDQIVKTLKNATKLKDVIEKLCNSLAEHLNCEKSRENFDFKLSTLLRNRIKAENNDMKAHGNFYVLKDFDSLSKVLVSHGLKITNKLFLHFLTHENYEVPDVDFGRAIDEINTKSVFRKSKFYTSSLEDISRISESKSENDIYIDQPPFMLQPIKEDAHIPSTSKGSDKENDKPSSDGSVKTNDVNETQITDSGGTQTSITITECYNETSSETFVDNRDFIRRSNTDDLAHPVKNGSNKAPSRSQSEKREKNEREPKLEECLDPESGISLNVPLHTSDNALVTKKVEPEIRMESKMENSESSTPASNTLDIIEKRSIDSDEILVDIKEFIQRQV